MTDTTKHLSLKAAYEWAAEHGLGEDMEKIRGLEIEWDLPYTSSLRRGYVVDLFERKQLFERFKKDCWSNGNTPGGERLRARYLRILEQYQSYEQGGDGDDSDDSMPEQAFAAESDLRDFLAANLNIIEPRLQLYADNGLSGVEFPVAHGRIDILAKDSEGVPVVIELKLSKGRNKALGQLLYYMGWVDSNLGSGPCRGVIVAREISEELRTAVKRTTGVRLFRYHLHVTVEGVG